MDILSKQLNISLDELQRITVSDSIETRLLLKFCKILNYDFFRIYTQHLILYAPTQKTNGLVKNKIDPSHQFRKNIYTKEIIEFILSQIKSKEKTPKMIIEEYSIPITTLYKWMKKYLHTHE